MRYEAFSRNQLKLLTWWLNENNNRRYDGIIAEGAIRSGKTSVLSLSFVLWAFSNFDDDNFALCGKSISSLRRNLINPLKKALQNRGFSVVDRRADNELRITKGSKTNTFYLFGGKDERSQDYIQGLTLSGILFDEVALMPESFVNQATARCSIENSKHWFNCNPEGPAHWFKTKWIDNEDMSYLIVHTTLDDNPALSDRVKDRYRRQYQGVFYKRFILGEWAAGIGIIYDCFDEKNNCYDEMPLQLQEDGAPYYSCDYGTTNPTVFLESYIEYKDLLPRIYVENEYYYDSKVHMKQKSDKEYTEDFVKFNNDKRYKDVIIDPAASSFIVSLKQAGFSVKKADNDVLPGIQLVYTLFANGLLKINKKNCPNLIKEIYSYSWDEKSIEKGEDKVNKKYDHACDALRYLCYTVIKAAPLYYALERTK